MEFIVPALMKKQALIFGDMYTELFQCLAQQNNKTRSVFYCFVVQDTRTVLYKKPKSCITL